MPVLERSHCYTLLALWRSDHPGQELYECLVQQLGDPFRVNCYVPHGEGTSPFWGRVRVAFACEGWIELPITNVSFFLCIGLKNSVFSEWCEQMQVQNRGFSINGICFIKVKLCRIYFFLPYCQNKYYLRLNIIKISGSSIKSFNNICLFIIRKRNHTNVLILAWYLCNQQCNNACKLYQIIIFVIWLQKILSPDWLNLSS